MHKFQHFKSHLINYPNYLIKLSNISEIDNYYPIYTPMHRKVKAPIITALNLILDLIELNIIT